MLPPFWSETGLSLDGIFSVSDSSKASFFVNGDPLWVIPSHTKFVNSNDVKCSYQLGFSKCNKSQDRLILPEIDLSSKKSGTLVINFESFFSGKLGSKASVEVSIDHGATWQFVNDLPIDASNWVKSNINLSNYIGNDSIVISFLYDDSDLLRDGLALDNIEVKFQKAWKDVKIESVTTSEYSELPFFEYDSIPLSFSFVNIGSQLLDTVKIGMVVYDEDNLITPLYTSYRNVFKINVGEKVNQFFAYFFPVKSIKKYKFVHTVYAHGDTIKSNDTIVTYFKQSENTCARDYGVTTNIFDILTSNTITLGNVMKLSNPAFLDSMDFILEQSSKTSTTNIAAHVYKIKNGIPDELPIATSSLYTLQSSSFDTLIRLSLKNLDGGKVKLDAGNYLFAIYKYVNGKTIGLKMANSYYKDNTVLIRIGNSSFQTLDSYYSGTKKVVPKIRAFVSPYCTLSAKINESKADCKTRIGQLTASALNARYPVLYQWSNNDNDSVAQQISAGNYKLKITDNFGCVFDTSNIVLSLAAKPQISIDSLRYPKCYGSNDGYISVKISDNNLIKAIWWNNQQTNNPFNENIPAGNYWIKTSNFFNCVDSFEVILSNPDSLYVSYSVKDEVTSSLGEIYLNPIGGVLPYTFDWGDTTTLKYHIGLHGDSTYTVIIKDKNNCTKSLSIRVNKILWTTDMDNFGAKVFPNPVLDLLFIQSDSHITDVSFQNEAGVEIPIQPNYLSDDFYLLNIEHCAPGIYFLRMNIHGIEKNIKVVKL